MQNDTQQNSGDVASVDDKKQREIASRGGENAREDGGKREVTPQEAGELDVGDEDGETQNDSREPTTESTKGGQPRSGNPQSQRQTGAQNQNQNQRRSAP